MSPTVPPPLNLPPCPECGQPVESFNEAVYKAPWVEPCKHLLTPEQLRDMHAEFRRRRARP